MPQESQNQNLRNSTIGHVVRRGLPLVVLFFVVVAVYLYLRQDDHALGPEAQKTPQAPVAVTVVTVQKETVPMRPQHANLLAWRARMATRPAVRVVIGRMADYLRSIDYPVPPYD